MKKLAILIAAIALIGTPAFAARMAVKAPPPPPPPVYSWTGFYIGGNAGYAWGHFDPASSFTCPTGTLASSCAYAFPVNQVAVDNAATGSVSANGFTGGIEAGYNWEFNRVVYGIETDFNAFHLSGSLSSAGAFPAAVTTFAVNASAKTDWLYTLRGRLGWTVTPVTLLYATGGLAVTEIHVSNFFTDSALPPTTGASSSSTTKAGWTLGGGAEWALNQNWTVKAEYLHVDFGSVGTTLVTNTIPVVAGPNNMTTSTNLRANIVRAGVNYKFW